MGKRSRYFFIVLEHVSQLSNPVTTWGNSFKIVIFFIISGYLLSMKDYSVISTREFTIRKLKSFGIPYAIFLLIAVVFSIAYETYRGKLSFYILFDIVYSALSLKGISTLWFIPVLFIGEILYVYNKKNNGVRQFVIFICSVFVLLILHFSVGQCRLLDDSYMFVFLYPCMVLEKSVIAFLLIL